jgi:chromate reductase
MSVYKIALIVGSSRKESINQLLGLALSKMAPSSLNFELINIADLPMYHGDLEGDRPAEINRFTAEVAACQGVLIITPEYNRSIPAVLKNAIDWGSKPAANNVWKDKPTCITGTTPGAIGTAVAQQHLRQILGIVGATVMGGEAYITFKPNLIDKEGHVTDATTHEFLSNYINRFATLVEKLAV